MKRILLLFSVLAFQNLGFAQDMWGVSNSNFAGSTGMNLNPASMMLTPYCWEVTLVTLNVDVENNYMGIIKDKKAMLMSDANPDIVEDHIVNTYHSNATSKVGLHVMAQLPSFIYKTNEWAFGFRPQLRTDLSVRGVPVAVSQLSYMGMKRANLEGTNVSLAGLNIGAMTWMQYGFSAGHQLSKNDDRIILGAASINFLNAYEGGYMKVTNGSIVIPDDSTLSLNNLSGTAAQAISTEFPIVRCNGISTDIGVEYISKPGHVKYKDGKEKEGKKYDYRVGVSLVDVGFVKFSNASNFQFNDASVTYVNPSGLKANGIEGADSLIQASVGASPSKGLLMSAPTAVSVQFDKSLTSRFYFNVSGVQRLPMPVAMVKRANNISMSLRYETPFFEVSLPYSFYDYYRHRIGFAMRYHFLFAGTDKLGTFVGQGDITGLDVYFGIKLTNFDFKKKSTSLCCKSYY
jgi:hypothetical protein